LIEHTL